MFTRGRNASPIRMDKVPVYILAGGKSSRFGSDKARVPVEGEPLIVHVVREVTPISSSMTVVAEVADKYADLGLRTIQDVAPGLGPMGGLQTALDDLECEEWLLLLSCDLIGIRLEWIELLIQNRNSNFEATLYRGKKWQPFLALYHRSIKEGLVTQISDGNLTLWKLFERCPVITLPCPPDWNQLRNVNTQSDLEN